MTCDELYNLRHLPKEAARLERRIAELRCRAEQVVPSGGGGGSRGGASDKVGSNAAKIADLTKELENSRQKAIDEEMRAMLFVESLTDARLRLIIQLFFIDGLSWRRVADEIGGHETENSCKQYCKRKLKELEG